MNIKLFIFQCMIIAPLCILVGCNPGNKKIKVKTQVADRPIKFDMIQDSDTTIRFGKNHLQILVGNITGNQARLTLKKDKLIIIEEYIHTKDEIVFNINNSNYKITCSRLQNLLIAHDFGTFLIAKTKQPLSESNSLLLEQQKIIAMLDLIRNSDIIFIRNGKSYPPKEAYNHLKVKYKRLSRNVKTLEDFIREIATQSFFTDRPYKIKQNNKVMYMKDWLNAMKDSI